MIELRSIRMALLAALLTSLPASAQVSSDDLLALAAELRDLRTQMQTIEAGRETYERHQLMDLDLIRQEQHARDAVLEALAVKKRAIEAEQAELDLEIAAGQKDKNALPGWISAEDSKLVAAESVLPVMFADADVVLERDSADELANQISAHFNNLLLLAEHTRVCQVRREGIDGADTQRVDILRVGALFEYYVSAAGDCAIRGNSSTDWIAIDDGWAPRLRTAIRVVRREIPAQVIVVPVTAELMR